MTSATIRTALARSAIVLASAGLFPAAASAADQPEVSTEPLTVTCADLYIRQDLCVPGKISKSDLVQLIVRNQSVVAALVTPLVKDQALGRPGMTPPPPSTDGGDTPAKPMMPVLDSDTYMQWLDSGISRKVVVKDLDMEVDLPVIDCRYAICLPPWLSAGPSFVDWKDAPVPAPQGTADAPKAE